jgi:hypothetical protein
MNTTHKWNSYNDYSYTYYSQRYSVYQTGVISENDEPQNVASKAEEYTTNFINLPDEYKVDR